MHGGARDRQADATHRCHRPKTRVRSDQLRADLVEQRRETIAKLPQIQQRLLPFLHEVEATLGSIEEPGRAERSTSEEVARKDATTN